MRYTNAGLQIHRLTQRFVEAPNQAYLEMIMDDYAGIVSEFTAINQYLYHYFETKKYDDLREMFESIAINEMLHMEILAKLINLLGGRPRGGPVLEEMTEPAFCILWL